MTVGELLWWTLALHFLVDELCSLSVNSQHQIWLDFVFFIGNDRRAICPARAWRVE